MNDNMPGAATRDELMAWANSVIRQFNDGGGLTKMALHDEMRRALAVRAMIAALP